jgi:hypothetical protein
MTDAPKGRPRRRDRGRLAGQPAVLLRGVGRPGRQRHLPDRVAHLEQLPRRNGSWVGVRGHPERMDFDAYLDFLGARGHNFIRLWRRENFKSQAAGGDFHLCMAPQPWARTGPGEAKDGKPKLAH